MKDMSIRELLSQLWHSDWSEGKDATPWDCTFQAGEERDIEWARFRALGTTRKTWYRSYVSSWVGVHGPTFSFPSINLNLSSLQTQLINPSEPFHIPSYARILTSAPMWVTAYVMGGFDFHKIKPMPKFLADYISGPSEQEEDDDISDGSSTVFEDAVENVVPSREAQPDRGSPPYDVPKYLLPEDKYFANDGVVPLVSQWHPGHCEYVFSVSHSSHCFPR